MQKRRRGREGYERRSCHVPELKSSVDESVGVKDLDSAR
jgi:hypothetical protein